MSRCQQVARPIALCLRPAYSTQLPSISTTTAARLFSTSSSRRDVEPTTTDPSSPSSAAEIQAAGDDLAAKAATRAEKTAKAAARNKLRAQWLDPNTTTLFWAERELMKRGINPIGSRRRRAAVRTTLDIPFEQLPYHAFQEARKILAADRREKIEEIKKAHQRVKNVEAMPDATYRGGRRFKQKKLQSLREHLEYLIIQADINDPAVRRKWEDGLGDFTKPIYRYFAKKKWLSMAYKKLVQRVEQFHIVPDVLPAFKPKMDVQLAWHGRQIEPGEKVHSLVSETPPNVRMQVFDNKKRLVTIVVMDSDVPEPETDSFGRRLHFMAGNIPIDCLTKNVSLNLLTEKHAAQQLVVPWLPPTSQEGAPYHRLSVWVLEQKDNQPLDLQKLREQYIDSRDGFDLRAFHKDLSLWPYGFNMFRTEWDNAMAGVMERHGIPGADIIYRRKKVRSLKPPKKARGWEAKRQGPKYRDLWKYTKRIAKSPGGT